jgi:hypothetical protein
MDMIDELECWVRVAINKPVPLDFDIHVSWRFGRTSPYTWSLLDA